MDRCVANEWIEKKSVTLKSRVEIGSEKAEGKKLWSQFYWKLLGVLWYTTYGGKWTVEYMLKRLEHLSKYWAMLKKQLGVG